MTAWIGVVSAEHVNRGVDLGIAQIGHGQRAGLARLKRGNTLIYYSPVARFGDTQKLQQFTAVGIVDGDDTWQAHEGDFHPFRRTAQYRPAHPVALSAIRDRLQFTAGSNWGYQLRRGLVLISHEDAIEIETAMTS
jgi:hypothetical protein